MEIRHEHIHHSKLKARCYEQIGEPMIGPQLAIPSRMLESADRRRTYSHNAASPGFGLIDLSHQFLAHLDPLVVDAMLVDVLVGHRLEGIEPDVQQDGSPPNTGSA